VDLSETDQKWYYFKLVFGDCIFFVGRVRYMGINTAIIERVDDQNSTQNNRSLGGAATS